MSGLDTNLFVVGPSQRHFGGSLSDEGPGSALEFQKSALLEIAIDSGHGVGVESEFYGQGANRGKFFPRSQAPAVDGEMDLFLKLNVNRG